MKQIRVSEKYWNSLSEKEQKFLQENVYDFGLMNCKRIITLSKYFGKYDEVLNFSRYNKENSILYVNYWLIIKDNKIVGMIYKGDNVGISERIKVRMQYDNKLHEVWNNWNSKNPLKTMFAEL